MKPNKKPIRRVKYEVILIIILCLFILFGLLLWQKSKEAKDFGLNFFTEMLGVLITILIIDRLIRNREQNRLLPHKMAIYKDVSWFTGSYIAFWTQTYLDSVPEKLPMTVNEFFSENGIEKILQFLDLDSKPNMVNHKKWWTRIDSKSKEIQASGDKILSRHAHHLEPEVYAKIHQLTESYFNKTLQSIADIKEYDKKNKFPRATNLGSYVRPPFQNDYESILFLFYWCESQYKDFKKNKFNVARAFNYDTMLGTIAKPNNMISAKKLKKQIKSEDDYRKKQN